MSTSAVLRQRYPRSARVLSQWRANWRDLGDQARFYGQSISSTVQAATTYRAEVLRQIAAIGLGAGSLAVVGGTVAVVAFLNLSTSAALASQAYNQMSQVGVEALAGFTSAFVNVRLVTPASSAFAFAATIGAGTTAQLGAMKINEEIDALAVMGIRPIAYLASTRLLAGVIVVVPLYCVALLMSFFAVRVITTAFYGQGSGVFDHYFDTFLNPQAVFFSFAVTVAAALVIMLIHTYYGLNATGGPAGVGEAVGRATRTSLIASQMVILLVTLALYGQTGTFNYAG
ncbi:ABC transporter permease [Mycolicibacterium elephantis]|uniref:ABC transporter permease n=1 Tax=Mycolicibacterium elephantis TaxID=81858 RepID=A0A1X0CJX4_9MYCO|nr:ABC transporter permease [Mycolicibacterium elephantis]ORA60497.1 ABC transporter permease [Mycolicibacterium elephantis]